MTFALTVSVLPTWHVGLRFNAYPSATSYSLNVNGQHHSTLTTVEHGGMLYAKRVGPFTVGVTYSFSVIAHVGQVTHETAGVTTKIERLNSWGLFYRQALHTILADAGLSVWCETSGASRDVSFCENEYGAARTLPDTKPQGLEYPIVCVGFPVEIGRKAQGVSSTEITYRIGLRMRDADNDLDRASGTLDALGDILKAELTKPTSIITQGKVSGIGAGSLEFSSDTARSIGEVVEQVIQVTFTAKIAAGYHF